MNITDNPRLRDLLAASYALGTLRGGARRRFEALARTQPALRAAALDWQERLAGMAQLQAPQQPDAAVWLRIRHLIEAEQAARQSAAAHTRSAVPARDQPSAAGWLRSLWLWRGASLAGALATVAAIGLAVNLRGQLDRAPTVQYVAVLADDKAAASLLVTFDARHGQLVLQRVGSYQPGADKSLQLWALPPGATPRSLGVLADAPALRIPMSEAQLRAVPALAVSLEPRGGVSGERGPTGPVLFHGPLVEKTL